MNRKLKIIVAIVVTCAALALSTTMYADSPAPANAQNQITVDITLNAAGEMTVGGISLKGLGLAPLDSQVTQVAKSLDSAHVVVQGEMVTVDVHGTPALKLQWTPASRQVVAALAARYGYAIMPDVMTRIEEWVSSSNLDVTARYTSDVSKPLTISLAKPIWVDLGPDGQVAIEKGPLAYGIDKSVMPTIQQSGAGNAILCWNKGTLSTKVDGKDLPSITLYPQGVQVLNQAFGLGIQNGVDPVFASLLGVDISLPGGTHQAGASCCN
jgi:hypothetical protein